MKTVVAAVAMVFFLAGLYVGLILGNLDMRANFRRQAVKMGHAYWTVDQDGNAQFNWKECKP